MTEVSTPPSSASDATWFDWLVSSDPDPNPTWATNAQGDLVAPLLANLQISPPISECPNFRFSKTGENGC